MVKPMTKDTNPKVPQLPLELVHLILDLLRGHQNALSSCTLVARHWQPFSRQLLFRRVLLRQEGEVDPFFEFLSSPFGQEITESIRHLRLGLFDDDAAYPAFEFDASLLGNILYRLPAVTMLEMRQASYPLCPEGSSVQADWIPRPMQLVSFDQVEFNMDSGFDMLKEASSLFSLFSTVSKARISIQGLSYVFDESDLDEHVNAPAFQVEDLQIDEDVMIFEVLRKTGTVRTVKTLRISPFEGEDAFKFDALEAFIEEARTSLEEIHSLPPAYPMASDFYNPAPPLPLRGLPRLRTVLFQARPYAPYMREESGFFEELYFETWSASIAELVTDKIVPIERVIFQFNFTGMGEQFQAEDIALKVYVLLAKEHLRWNQLEAAIYEIKTIKRVEFSVLVDADLPGRESIWEGSDCRKWLSENVFEAFLSRGGSLVFTQSGT